VIPKLTQLGALLAVIAGFVVLTMRGSETATYVSLTGPILGAMFVANKLDARSDAQDTVLTKISEQTNGVLTKRIQTAVHAALDARDKVNPSAPETGDPPAPVETSPGT
jgi:hypothetical protein